MGILTLTRKDAIKKNLMVGSTVRACFGFLGGCFGSVGLGEALCDFLTSLSSHVNQKESNYASKTTYTVVTL